MKFDADLSQHRKPHPTLERIYRFGVVLKGFDGAIELIAGLLLATAPNLLHALLGHLVNELQESQLTGFVAERVARLDSHVAAGSLIVVVIFLISHGLIKLALVYALLKEILWAYPYALGLLGLFLLYQMYVFIEKPGFVMGVFVLLDSAIIYLVWREWRTLRAMARSQVKE